MFKSHKKKTWEQQIFEDGRRHAEAEKEYTTDSIYGNHCLDDGCGSASYYVDNFGYLNVYYDGKLIGSYHDKNYNNVSTRELEQEVEDIIDSYTF